MKTVSVGQLMIDDAIPEDLRRPGRVLDKKGMAQLLQEVAEKHPDDYRDISFQLLQLGRQFSGAIGGFSISGDDLRPAKSALKIREELRSQMSALLDDDSIDDQTRRDRITEIASGLQNRQTDEVFKESLDEGNPLAKQVLAGVRGNKSNISTLRGSDMLYTDHRDRVIPIPVMHSYSEGLWPIEYWAGSYGARRGVLATKMSVRDAGYAGKQLTQMAHRLIVSDLDQDGQPDHLQGLPVDTSDGDSEGSLLAHDVGGFKRNTVLTPKHLARLRAQGIERILVRSPAVGGAPDGSLYARDVGVRERGGLPARGEFAATGAMQSLCLDDNTEIRMFDGSVKRIIDVVPGDVVLACSVAGILRPSRVVNVYRNGIKPCVQTTYRLGTGKSVDANLLTVTSTVDHKILSMSLHACSKVRRPVAKISRIEKPTNRHQRVYAKLPSGYDDHGHETEPFALAVGLLIGDGCYTGYNDRNNVTFSCHDPSLIDDVSEHFKQLGCGLTPLTTPGEYLVSDLLKGKRRAGRATEGVRNPLRAKLIDLGLWGQRSHTKQLPDTSHWTNNSVSQLLGGLLATDGCVHRNKEGRISVSYSSNSPQLVRSVRELLALRFGIYSSAPCASRKKRKDGVEYLPVYVINVNGFDNISRLAAAVQIPGAKGPRLAEYLRGWKVGNKSSESGRCSLVSQRDVGLRSTSDIEVDHPDHLFVLANWLVVSNSEPLLQAGLSEKHSGGVKGAGASKSAFETIDALIQSPENFEGGATHSDLDGVVDKVETADIGGNYVTVGGKRHYVPASLEVAVKPGQQVEAGDMLSNGYPHPDLLTFHKGIGEGRRQFVDAFGKAMRGANLKAHRRNLELLARGLIHHVRLTDEYGDYAPDEVVPYETVAASWQPRPGFQSRNPEEATGKYLERPVLHYTIGTKVQPSMLAQFKQFGVKSVDVHDDPPPFVPELVRGAANLRSDPDWITRMYGSGQKGSLLNAAHRGATSDPMGTSFIPALYLGKDFGSVGKVQSPKTQKWPINLDTDIDP